MLIVFFLAFSSCQHSGAAPSDYGHSCDPEDPQTCSDAENCALSGMHGADQSEEGRATWVCSLPCYADYDCPEDRCDALFEDIPYRCMRDGYCYIPDCANP